MGSGFAKSSGIFASTMLLLHILCHMLLLEGESIVYSVV